MYVLVYVAGSDHLCPWWCMQVELLEKRVTDADRRLKDEKHRAQMALEVSDSSQPLSLIGWS